VAALAAATLVARGDAGAVATLVCRLRAVSLLARAAGQSLAAWRDPGRAGGWSGMGQEAFVRAAAIIQSHLGRLGDASEAAADALAALSDALHGVQREVWAAGRLLAVAGAGDPIPAFSPLLAHAVAEFAHADRRAAALLCEVWLADLARVSSLGPQSAGVRYPALEAARGLAVPAPAPMPVDPPAVAVWWAGLSAAERTLVSGSWPGAAGSIDGIPAPVRDAVNRRRLGAALRDARRSYARTPVYDTYAHEFARSRLRRLEALAVAVRPAGRQLLVFDPSGDGEAAVSTASVETSRSVAVLVPGMTTELDDVPSLVDEAGRLAAAAGAGTAAVAWLGYDAPDRRQAVTDTRARSGARALQRFVAGLRSTAALRQHVTVLGHSYGSLVAGLAARQGLAADDLVLLASPGVEAARASQLRLPAGHVWVARAPTDPIQLVFWPRRFHWVLGVFGVEVPSLFGPDPAAAAFGAKHFPDGGAYGHSGYFAGGTQSLASLARIVAAQPGP
jgi:Alpha/beta hydrolase